MCEHKDNGTAADSTSQLLKQWWTIRMGMMMHTSSKFDGSSKIVFACPTSAKGRGVLEMDLVEIIFRKKVMDKAINSGDVSSKK